MEIRHLNVKERDRQKKGNVKKLRRNGFIPAILYGEGDNIPLIVSSKELTKILEAAGGINAILNLKFEGKEAKEYTAIIKELQKHPLRREILHADLMKVSMDKEIKVGVKIKLIGEPIGVKEKGGVLAQQMREIRVLCLPSRIPNEITVDVSNLDVGKAIHIRDILAGEGIKMLEGQDATVVSVSIPKVEEVKAEVAVTEVPAEAGAVAAPAEETEESGKKETGKKETGKKEEDKKKEK